MPTDATIVRLMRLARRVEPRAHLIYADGADYMRSGLLQYRLCPAVLVRLSHVELRRIKKCLRRLEG